MHSVDEICQCWVVVSGFFPDNHRGARIQDIFNARGTVTAVKESTGNWVLVRFSSAKEAVRAVQHSDGVVITDGILVGARQLTTQIAQSMNLQLTADGGFVSVSGGELDGLLVAEGGGERSGRHHNHRTNPAHYPEGHEIGSGAEGAWDQGAGYHLTAQDPEYVNSNETMRRRGGGSGSGGGNHEGVSGDRHTPQRITLRGSHVEVAGPVSPSLYLRPVKRDSLCDKVMRYFGFR